MEKADRIKDFIFGYGSLMEHATRTLNGITSPYLQPARINGYLRGWLVKQKKENTDVVFLGTVPDHYFTVAPGSVNGIIYEVSPEQLIRTDAFEGMGYHRILLEPDKIKMLDRKEQIPEGRIWMYAAAITEKKLDEKDFPGSDDMIQESYLQTCLRGCDEIENRFSFATGFKKEFLAGTFFRDLGQRML